MVLTGRWLSGRQHWVSKSMLSVQGSKVNILAKKTQLQTKLDLAGALVSSFPSQDCEQNISKTRLRILLTRLGLMASLGPGG